MTTMAGSTWKGKGRFLKTAGGKTVRDRQKNFTENATDSRRQFLKKKTLTKSAQAADGWQRRSTLNPKKSAMFIGR